ncbi:ribulose bisphosphate carboxylase small subunit [Synechococcus sp. PCC 7502]|uniref:AAA family ATPase n=1 Tax=Synechococcus sp. PCC 7502 TaxID=1173263 RepID=UPI00029FE3F4|nr:AAA family ATPase [Synechococcus sp. PCC 7502]AFY72666.1 ribulose bisphosphate carboxylase small subunit [Synechococcus sp. PCC 7502]
MNYYISPRFLDKLAVHITKNFLNLPGLTVPLILGIHGRKGEGKSFQCELVFKLMGIEPVRMSAGELESPDAGDPVRLIRTRYREAADLIKVRGKMCVLLINDIDAGAGRVDSSTQYTVNTQLVNGTLMNIADNPTDVQLPGSYETEPISRVPILLTGNDFSTLYAPLLRDGRMEKFYWEPTKEDRIGIVTGIFKADGLTEQNVEELISNFPHQSIDFFGALRSQVYDQQVRDFIREIGINKVSTHIVNNPDLTVKFQQSPNFGLPYLIKLGNMMVHEQQRVQSRGLVEEYTTGQKTIAIAVPPISTSEPAKDYLSKDHASTPLQELPNNLSGTYTEIERLLENGLRQGGRLSLEIATPREKAQNSWRSWQWQHQPQNVTEAMQEIQSCVEDHPKSFIRLVGYNPKTQIRVLQEVIIRP